MRKILLVLAFFIIAAQTLTAQTRKETKPIKAMIITGQDGSHFWRGGSEAIEMILENSGLFEVDIVITPPSGADMSGFTADFDKYQVVIINYGGQIWPEATQRKFEEYVENGGGMVAIHSSVVPLADWKEYNLMIGMGAWDGRNEKDGPYLYWKDGRYVYDYSVGPAGLHVLQHPTIITHRNTEHPIMKGLNPVWLHSKDEIYTRLRGPVKNMTVLATTVDEPTVGDSGRNDPMMWTVDYGKGRVFVDLLGHCGNDPNMTYSMECTGFQVTLLRGVEWAATGAVTQAVPADFPSEGIITLRPDFKEPNHRR